MIILNKNTAIAAGHEAIINAAVEWHVGNPGAESGRLGAIAVSAGMAPGRNSGPGFNNDNGPSI